jgi:hypothetical protein
VRTNGGQRVDGLATGRLHAVEIMPMTWAFPSSGRYRTRTCDLSRVKAILGTLSTRADTLELLSGLRFRLTDGDGRLRSFTVVPCQIRVR